MRKGRVEKLIMVNFPPMETILDGKSILGEKNFAQITSNRYNIGI